MMTEELARTTKCPLSFSAPNGPMNCIAAECQFWRFGTEPYEVATGKTVSAYDAAHMRGFDLHAVGRRYTVHGRCALVGEAE